MTHQKAAPSGAAFFVAALIRTSDSAIMKGVRLAIVLLLLACVVAVGLAAARTEGWHLAWTGIDDGLAYPTTGAALSLDGYEITIENLVAGDPHRATITLLSEKAVVVSLKQLHRGVCQRVQQTHAEQLARPPFRETAIFGLFERQAPIEITLHRSKNSLNPFGLLVIMSNQTEDSVDPFVLRDPDVTEVFTLTSRRLCGADAKKPALIWRALAWLGL